MAVPSQTHVRPSTSTGVVLRLPVVAPNNMAVLPPAPSDSHESDFVPHNSSFEAIAGLLEQKQSQDMASGSADAPIDLTDDDDIIHALDEDVVHRLVEDKENKEPNAPVHPPPQPADAEYQHAAHAVDAAHFHAQEVYDGLIAQYAALSRSSFNQVPIVVSQRAYRDGDHYVVSLIFHV